MSSDLVTVPSVLLDRLVTLGIDVPALLRLAVLPASRFAAPKARLTVAEFFAFWRAMEPAGGSREIILRLGADALPHQLDVVSLAALHAANLGDGLAKLARYKRVVCAESVDITIADGEARIGFHWVHVVEDLPLALVDVSFASILALVRRGTGRAVTPRRLELARRRADEPVLARHFGCEIRFDAPVDLLVLDEPALALPFVTHNADLLAMMVPGLEAALASGSVADDVRVLLNRHMSGDRPSVERIAAQMRMSPRTLQRRLGELGTSYQHLLDEVRRDTARRLLGQTDLDASEVAFILGFEELSSFTRAFHGWEGVTPRRWRDAEAGRP